MPDQSAVTTISTADAVHLYALKLRWDGRWHISLSEGGLWMAIKDIDPLLVLTAASGPQLADKIEADDGR
jgi:hypothetical protein